MAHIIKYERLSSPSQQELTLDGFDIFLKYYNNGSLTIDEDITIDGTFVYLTFPDEATADAYIDEMNAVDETENSGHKRANITRYNN